MTIKEKVENNIVVFLLGALLSGFLAGIGTYKAIIEIAHLDVIAKGDYIGKSEIRCYIDSRGSLHGVTGECPEVASQKDVVNDLSLSIRNYFASQSWLGSDPNVVIGLAKGIVLRFDSEKDVFRSIENQIERYKKEDANWTYANRLQSALALVYALGLTPDSKERNKAFQNMVVPDIEPKPLPRPKS